MKYLVKRVTRDVVSKRVNEFYTLYVAEDSDTGFCGRIEDATEFVVKSQAQAVKKALMSIEEIHKGYNRDKMFFVSYEVIEK